MRNISSPRRIVADGLYTFALRVTNLAISAGIGVLTARLLEPYGRGIYVLPMVTAAMVTAIYPGLTSATSYFLLRNVDPRAVLRAAYVSALAFVTIGAAVVYVLAVINRHPWVALPAALALPGTAGLLIAYGYAIGTHRVRINSTLSTINSLTLAVTMTVALTLVGHAPTDAIAAWLIATNLVGLTALIWVWIDAGNEPVQDSSVSIRAFLSFSARVGGVSLVSLLNYRADVFLVAAFMDPKALGIYALAVAAAEALLTATQITSLVTQSHVGSLDLPRARIFTAQCMRHNMFLAILACVFVGVCAPWLVSLLYGTQFAGLTQPLRILLIGVFALSLGSPLSNFFTIRLGKPEVALVLASISASICIGSSLILIPRFGLVGAAWASTAAYCIGQLIAMTYFSKTSEVSMTMMLRPRKADLIMYLSLLRTRDEQERLSA